MGLWHGNDDVWQSTKCWKIYIKPYTYSDVYFLFISLMKKLFDKRIFWDISDVDYMKHKLSVIFRVIRYGDLSDFKHLRSIYSLSDIKYFLKRRWSELDIGEKKFLDLLYKHT